MSIIKPVTKSVIVRTWADVDPKIAAAFLSGGVAAAIVITLHAVGIRLTSPELALIPAVCAIIGGYLKASTHKGDLLAKIRTDGVKDAETLAPLVAAAVPVAAPAITTAEDIVTALTTTQILDTLPAVPVSASGSGQ